LREIILLVPRDKGTETWNCLAQCTVCSSWSSCVLCDYT